MLTITPEQKETCSRAIARWFAEHRRVINMSELLPIVHRHFPESPEFMEFIDYIQSEEGSEQFGKLLRFEAWRAGVTEPPELEPPEPEPEKPDFWLGIAGAERKFPLGQIVMTRGVADLMAESDEFAKFCAESLRRHARGDWGDLTEEDKRENEYSLTRHLRLLSAYEKYPLPKIWIITEADRSVTTLLFPEEY